MTTSSLNFPAQDRAFLEPHLPPTTPDHHASPLLPFTTLTFATSLDSSIAAAPGTRTVLSGPQSKAMTHYLRSQHAAILIGVGTAIADNPGLNCRIAGVGGYGSPGLSGQPRPIIIDPSARWAFAAASKIFELVRSGQGRAPFIVIAEGTVPAQAQREVLEAHGGKFIVLPAVGKRVEWRAVLECLVREGLRSVMVEGGGEVINSLLETHGQGLVQSVVVTIAPTWLGRGGVVVSPERRVEGAVAVPTPRLTDVKWYPFGEDVVLCGRLRAE
ncbi:riboflavin-specific deaminase [Aspergillus ellipticus CBS 707.79]|uniref:2,5-diamino-6-ribosylamino-4(3H)-pyrimidinone 5'-phosphate reductase n=1 Tax=Aspergillus ellipticus CBS 707.79 TaxID=1448320 RepID=A0A319CXF8_9EURO|nr:riboflavin-specific deaminase [Aspergillus ellipticus CBS 707.79]